VEGGVVLVGGAPADKPSRLVAGGDALVVVGPGRRFVSRGGDKLAAALEQFALDVSDVRALDAGASTGGFTDCLLQAGAATVTAVDVGYGQLHPKLRGDRRVRVFERTNIRSATPSEVGGPFGLVVADLSFISLVTVVPRLAGDLAEPGAPLVLLVKPQFEAGRAEVSKGRGVVRDPEVRRRTLHEVVAALLDTGATIMGAMASPVLGPAGNIEFFLHAVAHGGSGGLHGAGIDAALHAAVAESPGAL